MLNRNETKSTKAIQDLKAIHGATANVSFVMMDLADLESVRRAAAEINQKIDKIDALICNAAIAQVPTQKRTKDGFESQLGVNHYGHFLNWDKNYHPMNTYCHSKLAQMMFGYELQDKITATHKNVKVYVCHPGSSATSLIKNSGSRKDRIIFGIMAKTPLVQSAEKGAYPEVMCATEAIENLDQKAYYGPTGRMQWTGPVGECKLEPHAQDKAVAAELWKVSEQATNYKWTF